MKKHTFIIGAVILTVGGFIAKIIGAFYKIPLTNILGSSGMGIYYLVFPLYSLLLVISSSGVSIAVSKLVAEARVQKIKRNETAFFVAGLTISFIVSFIFSLLMIVFAGDLAFHQGNVLAKNSFIGIAPALICASLVAVIKGYFQGIENMFPSSVSMILEQVVKLIAGLLLAYKFLPYGIEFAVLGSILAVSISELLTFIIMLINYFWHKARNDYKFYSKTNNNKLKEIKFRNKILKKVKRPGKGEYNLLYFYNNRHYVTYFQAIKCVLRETLPNTLTSLVIPLISLIDSFLVLNLLIGAGFSSFTATSLYGISNGIVSTLISLPVIISSSIATAVMPNLSGLVATNKKQEINKRVSFFIKITLIIVLPIFIYFLIMSFNIINALYNFTPNNVVNEYAFASKLLSISSVTIIYNAFLSTFVSILQSINKPYKVFFIMLIAMIIRTLLLILLLRVIAINIFAVAIANIMFLIICDVLCLNVIRKNLKIKMDIKRGFFVPILSGIVATIVTYFVSILLANANVWIILIVCGCACVVSYFGMLILLKCFSGADVNYLPTLKLFKS